ncbi:hypothetical protein ABIE44_002069 [Marmoricola sp. OAE513]|uniref:hypothetical protein n=1 Tax=Marmoricola sp. OAE513 TaxID=2817894 RepID=UPI001AE38F80
MKNLTTAIVGSAAVLAVLAPTAATASSTHADAAKAKKKHFTVVQKFEKAKLGVCKVDKGDAWKVYGRLDTRKVASGKHMGSLFVIQAGKDMPTDTWRSAMIAKGKYSKVGAVKVPKTGGYSLQGGVGGMNAGNGGPIKISKIRKC